MRRWDTRRANFACERRRWNGPPTALHSRRLHHANPPALAATWLRPDDDLDFFNRVDGGELRYVSYHYESLPEIFKPRGGALSVLDGLLRSS